MKQSKTDSMPAASKRMKKVLEALFDDASAKALEHACLKVQKEMDQIRSEFSDQNLIQHTLCSSASALAYIGDRLFYDYS